ncbi:uncharacterized protein V6R79_008847 [Siganus canaliculatus]
MADPATGRDSTSTLKKMTHAAQEASPGRRGSKDQRAQQLRLRLHGLTGLNSEE